MIFLLQFDFLLVLFLYVLINTCYFLFYGHLEKKEIKLVVINNKIYICGIVITEADVSDFS